MDLTIALADGSKSWNLAGDVTADLLQDGKGNPHADRFGDAGVWSFWDMADSRRGQASGRHPALAAWDRAEAGTRPCGRGTGGRRVPEGVHDDRRRSPFWIKNAEDEAALPADARDAGAAARMNWMT